jgi:hypothetical protein
MASSHSQEHHLLLRVELEHLQQQLQQAVTIHQLRAMLEQLLLIHHSLLVSRQRLLQ